MTFENIIGATLQLLFHLTHAREELERQVPPRPHRTFNSAVPCEAVCRKVRALSCTEGPSTGTHPLRSIVYEVAKSLARLCVSDGTSRRLLQPHPLSHGLTFDPRGVAAMSQQL